MSPFETWGVKPFAVQLDRVHTDVDEDLDAGGGLEAVGVAGREADRHLAVAGATTTA